MKVLLVNGSPHKNGCTHAALEEVGQGPGGGGCTPTGSGSATAPHRLPGLRLLRHPRSLPLPGPGERIPGSGQGL